MIPWIKSKIDADKLATIEDFAIIFVRSAEQLFDSEEWKKKKEYVMDSICKKAHEVGIELSEEDLNAIVESAVNYIKYGSEYNK